MDSKRVPSASRVYSTARMKRRANINQKSNVNVLDAGVLSDKSTGSEEGPLKPINKGKIHFKKISNYENVKLDSQKHIKSIPSNESKTASKFLKFPGHATSTAEYRFHSRINLLDKPSDSSFDSIDSPELTLNSSTEGKQYINPAKEIEKIKILATLLPDEILKDPVSLAPRFYETALMFPDVSGFTQLCEKFDKTGMGGPSRLTEVLNGYIGSMINIVLSRNGDVCKFGGDAFLCAWKVSDDLDITDVVHLALESAIDIQKHCGEYKTNVGVKLRVKVAVSAGKALFSIIGTNTERQYVIVGPPVMDIREAEQLCRAGEVIVTSSAWKYVKNHMFYNYTYHYDHNLVKVHDFGPLWKSVQISLKIKGSDYLFGNTRPILKYTTRLKVEDVRPFILPPVMRSIDLNRPLDYLTEMRQVAIVFFNLTVNFQTLPIERVIALSNKAFQIISDFVYKSGGATNKLTLFDKDIAILTIFGLKGFKHELASQEALKCAYRSIEKLKSFTFSSVSAGVTTGMTYCGVIGHTLRKEYTVMGHAVNMAARLMCAYRNIVSCDRNTFLHSKLDSNHFEVLGLEYMKGIQNTGPFYKFNLLPERTKLKLDREAYPLLGRKNEVKQFEMFLKNGMNSASKINFMIIFGKARIGKSRLIAKLINIAEKQNHNELTNDLRSDSVARLEIYAIPLTEDDSKVSYLTTRLIFNALLGLGESSAKEEREDKILQKLGEIKDFCFLASLNSIFNVSFALTPQYLALSNAEQIDSRINLMRILYKKCFSKGEKLLIVIDDAEFIDDDSWNFLKWCSNESVKILYLLTIGQRRALTPAALDCLENIKAKKITLTEIDKWYYTGLACQILGVKAIPVELENLLQNYKSSGNPGWLESFLLSLIQSENIHITQISHQKMKTLGLVSAPDFMLMSSGTTDDEKLEGSEWTDCLETFESVPNKDSFLRVCMLGSNFRQGHENEAELTMDVMFIKTIDTLKPLQQLVLKAGSVLGNNLKRNALQFVISKDTPIDERQFARAIKNLFEIKILTCAKGNLTHSNLLMPRRMILVSSIRKEVTCECTDVIIPESCKNLPKYASCSFMQFRSPIFRDTVYNLLLDDQKKKFHSSCIEFLRKNTFKCNTCHNMPFTNVLGYEENDQLVLACTMTPMHGVRSTKLEPKSNHPLPSLGYRLLRCSFNNAATEIRKSFFNLENNLGVIYSAEKSDCQCSEILSSVYSVLLEHAAGSGRKDIMLEVQLEYASLSLTANNIPLTMQILEETLTLVNKMKEDKEHPEFCTPYIYGKIYTLMGATKLSMGRLNESLDLLKISLKNLNKSFPSNNFKLKFLIQRETTKFKVITEILPEKFIGSVSEKKALFMDLLSECLGMISIVYMYMQNWLLAKYASLMALTMALKSNRNFFGLCVAYTTMINVAFISSDLETCAKLEVCAISVCRRCSDKIIELYEWEAVCHLYAIIFKARHARAEIEEAAVIGFQCIKIASVMRSASLKLDLIPDLIFALIQLDRLSEAVALIQELEFMSQLDSDKSSRLWYYAICLDFHLYTGFTVVPYETCENFVKEEDDPSLIRDPDAKYRLYTSLWLWSVRNNEWELTKAYGRTLEKFKLVEVKKVLFNVFIRLERLEGLLITLVHKMDQRNIYTINATYVEIHALIKRLEKDVKTFKLFKPRNNQLNTENFDLLHQNLKLFLIAEEKNAYIFKYLPEKNLFLSLWLFLQVIIFFGLETEIAYTIFKIFFFFTVLISLFVSLLQRFMLVLDNPVSLFRFLEKRESSLKYQLLKSYYRQIRYRDDSYNRILNQAQFQAEKMKDINVYHWIAHLKMVQKFKFPLWRLVWSNTISPVQRDYWVEHSRHDNLEWYESGTTGKKSTIMYSLPLPKF